MWSGMEKRWRDALVHSVLPVSDEPVPDERWRRFGDSDMLVKIGFRASVWFMTFAAVGYFGRPFHRLDEDEADDLLRLWGRSDWGLVRQMVVGLKSVACLLRFCETSVRGQVDGEVP